MNGWLVYDRDRLAKNQVFVNRFIKLSQMKGMRFELVLQEDVVWNERNGLRLFVCGEETPLPDVVVMRTYLPALSRILEQYGVRVINNSRVAVLGNDKFAAWKAVKTTTVPVMPTRRVSRSQTYVCESDKNRIRFIMDENDSMHERPLIVMPSEFSFPLVVKTLAGHGGTGVFLANNIEEYQHTIAYLPQNRWIVQDYATEPGRDVRVYVLGNRIVTAMLRTSSTDFRSNYSLGGHAEVYELSESQRQQVERILALETFDFAGIDFIFDRGEFVFNEIEDIVGSRMVYQYGNEDMIELFVSYISNEVISNL